LIIDPWPDKCAGNSCEIIAVMSDLGRYEVTGFHPEALDALFDAIRATHVNGGVLIAQVRALEVDDPAR